MILCLVISIHWAFFAHDMIVPFCVYHHIPFKLSLFFSSSIPIMQISNVIITEIGDDYIDSVPFFLTETNCSLVSKQNIEE
jgi:hypothetical protein